MKKVVFVLVCLVGCYNLWSQEEVATVDKPSKYGFNFGINYSNLMHKGMLPSNAAIKNDWGFRMGILADYKISELFSISPKVELSLNNSAVNFSHENNSRYKYKVMPVSVDLMSHFVFKDHKKKFSPYFLFGPNLKIPISKQNMYEIDFSTRTDFALDFGIGINKKFTHFNFAPELRYSLGLLDVNLHPAIQTLKFHNITLVFNLLG